MNDNLREVKLSTKLQLLWQRPILTIISAYMLIFPLFFMAISYSLMNMNKDKSIPDVDYEEVNTKGIITSGNIINIESANEIINNEHPAVITYKYIIDNKEIESKFQTLSLDKVEKMKIGDIIEIKYLDDESIPTGLEPGTFPWDIFFYPPLLALFIGIVLTTFLLNSTAKKIKLYKYGTVKEAELISFMPRPGLPITGIGGGINVQYRYKMSGGHKMIGESVTKDTSIMKEKKPGDTIKIFVSPDDELKTCLIPQKEATRNNWKID
jgi:hypothetical protein